MKFIFSTFFFLAICTKIHAQPIGEPPQEAILACKSIKEGNSCSFQAPHGKINGTCKTVINRKFACVPSFFGENANQKPQSAPQNNSSAQSLDKKAFGGRAKIEIAQKNRNERAIKSLIPDSNQGSCFNNYQMISCPKIDEEFYGQDGNFNGTAPSYRDNKDGTISDLITGLIWQKSHNSQRKNYYDAKKYCESLTLGNQSDWRLPTIKELFSIADFRGSTGTKYFINSTYFELKLPDSSVLNGDPFASSHNLDMMGQTWSSTIYSGKHYGREGMEAAFFFNFLDGRIKQAPTIGRSSLFYRCVRGKNWGENIFIDNKDGTVIDQMSGLQWQKSDDGITRNWQQALKYCQNLKLGGFEDWRLPAIKELQSIVDYTKWNPAINNSYLNITDKTAWFWSSTTSGENFSMANYICFGPCTSKDKIDTHGAGAQRSDPKSGSGKGMSLGGQEDEVRVNNYTRCVR